MIYALTCAILLFLATPGKFSFPPLAWVALIPLLAISRRHPPKRAAIYGGICGLLYYGGVLYWITIVLGRYGGLPLWLSLPALLLLALYMGLYTALFAAALSRTRGIFPLLWLAPTIWVALDFIRAQLFSGFPWMDLAYSQYLYPRVIQVVDLAGHYGLTFVIVLTNAALFTLYQGLKGRRVSHKIHLGAGALLISLITLYSLWRYQDVEQSLTNHRVISLGVAQGNYDQSRKWLPELQAETTATYLDLSNRLLAKKRQDIIIWPETALPFFPKDSALFHKVTAKTTTWGGTTLVTGAPTYSYKAPGEVNYYNSALVIDHAPIRIQRYNKRHLVPFGEYIPFNQYLPSSMPLVHSMGNFTPGNSEKPITCQNGEIGLLICYESIFPDLAREVVKNGATLLINLTNDAWYGDSSAPWQQLAMVVFRAVENRRGLARAANTGISCFIDPLGRITNSSPLFERYTITADMPMMGLITPYTRYGYLFPWFCLFGAVAALLYAKKCDSRSTHVCRDPSKT